MFGVFACLFVLFFSYNTVIEAQMVLPFPGQLDTNFCVSPVVLV